MELPNGFIDEISGLGPSLADGLARALCAASATVSVRANRSKGIFPPAGADIVPWCCQGWYLDSRRAFTFDPALHQGLYYVQEASSMAVSFVISRILSLKEGPVAPLCCLDACAAPGGKATAMIDSLPEGSLLLANEYVPSRVGALTGNLIKWGCPGIAVSKGDTARFRNLPSMFDIVLADVPCSGEGMFRKDPAALAQWSPQLVEECVMRQKRIIENLWASIRPGGFMIYSTCTFNRRENEEMISYMAENLGALPLSVPFPSSWGIAGGIDTPWSCYRFFPHLVRGEGLFMALLEKPSDGGSAGTLRQSSMRDSKNRFESPSASALSAVKEWLRDNGEMSLLADGAILRAFPAAWLGTLALLRSKLDLVHWGVPLAELKGKNPSPLHSLALSTLLDASAFPAAELDYRTALCYLRREAIALEDAPRGYLLVRYGGRPLGFVKNLGNRANNLYPAPWRILSQHLPAERPDILHS